MPRKTHRESFLATNFASPRARDSFPVCRLGLATRGNTNLAAADILYAVERGVNFLNWCGTPNALPDVMRSLGPRRAEVMVCVQFEARTAADAKEELASILLQLGTDYVDVLTFYYVEHPSEWEQITARGGALEYCDAARRDGRVRFLGVTSHKRPLAADMARSGMLDMLMIRYNAAHRGAEKDIFPVTDRLGLPVVVYTCLRWGALLDSTPDDPPGFTPPPAPAWYRFALQSPSVTVALTAPDNRRELEENLTVLEARGALSSEEYQRLAEHGQRVRKYAGRFP